jgi:hypothetical protein
MTERHDRNGPGRHDSRRRRHLEIGEKMPDGRGSVGQLNAALLIVVNTGLSIQALVSLQLHCVMTRSL